MYTTFYKLREEPFHLTSDPKFFHLAEPHSIAATTVVEAVIQRKGFVVMTGAVGTGKTTVLHAALRILNQESIGFPVATAFVVNPVMSREEFLETILSEFETSSSGVTKPTRLAALHRMFLDMQVKGGTSVLLLDEAHLLSTELLEEIRLLSNDDTYQEKLLQVILCGQPELLPKLQRPELRALRQRISTSCSLRPLSFPEVRGYVAKRLYTAGLDASSYPFPTPALEKIFQHSGGVPRLINLICDSSLRIGCKLKHPLISGDIVEEAASELTLKQPICPSDPSEETSAAIIGTEVVNELATKSVVDLLITVMKQRRTSVTG